MINLTIRPHLRLALSMAAALLIAGAIARVVFMLWFMPLNSDMSWHDWLNALWLGLRYDIRVALLTVAAAWLLSSLPWLGNT